MHVDTKKVALQHIFGNLFYGYEAGVYCTWHFFAGIIAQLGTWPFFCGPVNDM
jgi:hypothetical protein